MRRNGATRRPSVERLKHIREHNWHRLDVRELHTEIDALREALEFILAVGERPCVTDAAKEALRK